MNVHQRKLTVVCFDINKWLEIEPNQNILNQLPLACLKIRTTTTLCG